MTAEMPDRMPVSIAALPRNRVGYPVPWFVAWIDGEPDFRVIRRHGVAIAYNDALCWICGQPRTAGLSSFVIGPMCAVNHVSAEPPSHPHCARWAAIACPFLARPTMIRRENGKPVQALEPAGRMLKRNPGVALVWHVRPGDWEPFSVGPSPDDVLFDVGVARATEWFAHGRTATRGEVLASIDSGLPLLHEMAETDGPDAVAALVQMHADALKLVPA